MLHTFLKLSLSPLLYGTTRKKVMVFGLVIVVGLLSLVWIMGLVGTKPVADFVVQSV